VICADGVLVGRITLNNILRGPLQSCFVSYWVAADHVRKGIATRALRLALDVAFSELSLHRVEAFTQVSNKASQLVLERNNFQRVGVLGRHIHIAGRWRDEFLFERIAPWDDGVRASPNV
jgi:ribosomal-protein-alanine N-acetyltransferase